MAGRMVPFNDGELDESGIVGKIHAAVGVGVDADRLVCRDERMR